MGSEMIVIVSFLDLRPPRETSESVLGSFRPWMSRVDRRGPPPGRGCWTMTEELLDLSLGLSLGGLYKEIKESPNPNPFYLVSSLHN
ncbi:hypothetical protein NL676_033934 [Syzygium grande]|nr:hypothetical protein NL676_033934 [Syzygium grande]